MITVLRWLGRNLSTLLMAFILAVIVWVSAVISEDPNVEDVLTRPVVLERIGMDPGLLIMGSVPTQVQLTLDAPTSIWRVLRTDEDTLRAWIDLSGLGPGEHTLPVNVQVSSMVRTARVVAKDPEEVDVNLERLVTQVFSVTLDVNGDPTLGYQAGSLVYTPTQVTVSGAESLVSQVKDVHTSLDISQASLTIRSSLSLRALDANRRAVSGVSIIPDVVDVRQGIQLLGGYKNVIVKVISTGQVAEGYKLTNIDVTPPNVVVFSSNPDLLDQLPGYVDTEPLDLTGAQDYLETPLSLSLPEGVSVVNDQKVLVQVSIAPIESNLTLSLPVERVGLSPGLAAEVAPETVDVIISGPLPVLNTLKPSDMRMVVDLTGLELGTHTLEPRIDFLPTRVRIVSILPASLEITIILAPTPTVTQTPAPEPTPTPTARP
jgi:YbbR domain-containing protein